MALACYNGGTFLTLELGRGVQLVIFQILYTPYISRGFYFREFRKSGAIREFINTRKYLPPIPTHECDLCTQYIALLDREFNHSRKCLKVPIREKLDSRNIWRIQ